MTALHLFTAKNKTTGSVYMKTTVTIDCTQFTSYDRVHRTFKNAGVDYDGENLDALFDALTSICTPTIIKMCGFDLIPKELSDYAEKLKRVLDDACEENQAVEVEF